VANQQSNARIAEELMVQFAKGVCRLANAPAAATLLASFMDTAQPKTLPYKRSHFATQLPLDYLYSPSHAWVAVRDGDACRVGLTKFATRMLGEMVDHGFEIETGASVQCGQIIGWVEGFKAISDLFCIAEGAFAGSNPVLKENIRLITRDPFGAGWLYEVRGQPDTKCLDVHAYRDLLDKTIDRILAQQKGEEIK
jgi:glycine cleavage system H protein